MLGIGVIKSSGSLPMARYYTAEFSAAEQAAQYYSDDVSLPARSRWWGDGSERLGLSGPVSESDLLAILKGTVPSTGQSLYDPTAQQLAGLARYLSIDRDLTGEDIATLRAGNHPVSRHALAPPVAEYVQQLFSGTTGPVREVAALDLTFSAPKSVGLLATTASPELQAVAMRAHAKAVQAALEFIEQEALVVRRGHEGREYQRADQMIVALVTQLASRLLDPQLHTHAVLSTAVRGEDGRISTLSTARLHAVSKVAGAIYQAQLRYELTAELGVAWNVGLNGLSEIAGVSQPLLTGFSRRSAQIAETLQDIARREDQLIREVELRRDQHEQARYKVRLNPEAATATDRARAARLDKFEALLRERATSGPGFHPGRRNLVAYTSRDSKHEPPEAELRQMWAQQFAEYGQDWDAMLALSRVLRAEQVRSDPPAAFSANLAAASTAQHSVFGRKEALLAAARLADPSWSAAQIVEQTGQWLATDALPVRDDHAQHGTWVLGGGGRWTTEHVLAQQRQMRRTAEAMLDRTDVAVCSLELTSATAAQFTLDADQENLLSAMCLSGAQLVVAPGIAGSGKTHVLGAAAEVLRPSGYRVIGLATAAAAAQRLAAESGFDRASSIDRFLTLADNDRWERGASPELLNSRAQLLAEKRAAQVHFDRRLADAGSETEQDRILEEQSAATGIWQEKWTDWLAQAAAEQQAREAAAARLEADWAELQTRRAELDQARAVTGEAMEDISPETVERLQAAADQLVTDLTDWHARREHFEAHMSPTEPLPADERVVIVVDEAGMVDDEHYRRLLALAEAKGWKLAFVGDERQLQAVNRGGMFGTLARLGGTVVLGQARRSRHAWERAAQRQWWSTEDPALIRDSANSYQEHGRITYIDPVTVNTAIASGSIEADTPEQAARETARQLLTKRWLADYDQGVESVIMAMRREDVHAMNNAVQSALLERGELDAGSRSVVANDVRGDAVADTYQLFAGDRVTVMHNVKGTAVKNGQSGSIRRILADGSVEVSLPTGPDGQMRTHILTPDHLREGYLAPGYAVTCHKAQGLSAERGYLLGDKTLAREQLYPGLTRGKDHNELVWILDDQSDETPLGQVAAAMARSTRKLTALEVLNSQITEADVQDQITEFATLGVTLTEVQARQIAEEQQRQQHLAEAAQARARTARQEQTAAGLATHAAVIHVREHSRHR